MQWLHRILDVADSRMRLFLLLTLNCGFGAAEIGRLAKGEYDPIEGRIRHKRRKTGDSPNVPTVCYKLWPETKAFLDQEIEKCKDSPRHPACADLLLVHRDSGVLWQVYVGDDGKPRKSDKITIAFSGLVEKLKKSDPEFPHITYYQFRRTSSTLISNDHQYRTYYTLWLGHSPQTMGDRHYNAADDTVLDACIAWLHRKIFGGINLLEREECQNGQG